MKVDLVGKIKNTQLPRSKALLPMFEAVVNSFQAIEERGNGQTTTRIEILVEREEMLPGMESDGDVNGFTITDNGVGFTEENLDSFFTSDTRYKIRKGGKGVGLFIWLKAFSSTEIESHFRENGKLMKRVFQFNTNVDQPESDPVVSNESSQKTRVSLVGMLSPYKAHCPHSLVLIGHRLIEHCLPFFLDPKCPTVVIRDEKETIALNQYFRDTFAEKASQPASIASK